MVFKTAKGPPTDNGDSAKPSSQKESKAKKPFVRKPTSDAATNTGSVSLGITGANVSTLSENEGKPPVPPSREKGPGGGYNKSSKPGSFTPQRVRSDTGYRSDDGFVVKRLVSSESSPRLFRRRTRSAVKSTANSNVLAANQFLTVLHDQQTPSAPRSSPVIGGLKQQQEEVAKCSSTFYHNTEYVHVRFFLF